MVEITHTCGCKKQYPESFWSLLYSLTKHDRKYRVVKKEQINAYRNLPCRPCMAKEEGWTDG